MQTSKRLTVIQPNATPHTMPAVRQWTQIQALPREIVKITVRPKRKEPTMSGSPPSGYGLNLNRLLEQLVSFADTKLSSLIGFSGVMVGLLLAEKPSFPRSFVHSPFEPLEALLAYVSPVTYSLALLSFAIATICACIGFYSGTGKEYQENVVSWRWIETQPIDKYQSKVNALTESAVEDAYTRENHRLSKRLRWRTRFVGYSAIAFFVGLLFAMASTGASFLVK